MKFKKEELELCLTHTGVQRLEDLMLELALVKLVLKMLVFKVLVLFHISRVYLLLSKANLALLKAIYRTLAHLIIMDHLTTLDLKITLDLQETLVQDLNFLTKE